MTIQQFAEQYRVKTRKDSCGEVIAPGKPRKTKWVEDKSHIYEHGNGEFGLCLMNPVSHPEAKAKYTNAKNRLLAAGFIQGQDGDSEGTFLFDGSNAVQAKLAIRESGIKVARVLSPEQRALLAKVGFKSSRHTVEGAKTVRESTNGA